MGVDHAVDLGHEADGFGQGDDDLVVMRNVFVREKTSGIAFLRAAVLEPFFADLVAADMEVPDAFGDRMKTAGAGLEFGFAAFAVDPDGAALVGCPADFTDSAVVADERSPGRVQSRRFQKMQGDEFAAEAGEFAEQGETAGQGAIGESRF